jgi:hypothetical protein
MRGERMKKLCRVNHLISFLKKNCENSWIWLDFFVSLQVDMKRTNDTITEEKGKLHDR